MLDRDILAAPELFAGVGLETRRRKLVMDNDASSTGERLEGLVAVRDTGDVLLAEKLGDPDDDIGLAAV